MWCKSDQESTPCDPEDMCSLQGKQECWFQLPGRALPLPQVGSSGNDSWHVEESDAAVGRDTVWEGP